MTINNLQLDDHKLLYHLNVLHDWHQGKEIYPLTISIGPTRACNYRCVFCAYDYLEHKPIYLDLDRIVKLSKDTAKRGTKSFFFSGDGEPLMNKELPDCIVQVYKNNIDTALNTNGVLLNKEVSEKILPVMSWIRVSVNAGESELYGKLHGTNSSMYHKVLNNLNDAVDIKKNKELKCTIGVQSLLLEENIGSLINLAKELKRLGVDYFALKPFLQHPSINYTEKLDYNSESVNFMLREIENISSEKFRVVIRRESLKKIALRNYERCLSFPFIADIDSKGDFYPCGPHIGNPMFCYGNIYDNDFDEIWQSEKRKRLEYYMQTSFDCSKCMPNCRNDAVNRFLWHIKQEPAHVNFI
ncbi:MAG: radical SAM protein [Desulfobacterales bacterium]|nr:radical SAM protein [Desulfobacterales bacterium]MBF0397329.1 radical SAM protein [Desulfobacterales bacterium]